MSGQLFGFSFYRFILFSIEKEKTMCCMWVGQKA
jgi:hypothetical protein